MKFKCFHFFSLQPNKMTKWLLSNGHLFKSTTINVGSTTVFSWGKKWNNEWKISLNRLELIKIAKLHQTSFTNLKKKFGRIVHKNCWHNQNNNAHTRIRIVDFFFLCIGVNIAGIIVERVGFHDLHIEVLRSTPPTPLSKPISVLLCEKMISFSLSNLLFLLEIRTFFFSLSWNSVLKRVNG